MQETWRESDPGEIANTVGIRPSSSAVVGWWWFAWILSLILGQIAAHTTPLAKTIDSLEIANIVMVVSNLAHILAAMLTIIVVRRIDRNQTRRYELVLEQAAVVVGER